MDRDRRTLWASVLTIDTARSALAHAAFDLIQAHFKEVAAVAR